MATTSYAHATISVGATATALVETGLQNDGVLIQNRGPVPVYIGGSTVTADISSTGGLLLAPGDKVTVSTVGNVDGEIYAITSTGTAYVSWIEVTL